MDNEEKKNEENEIKTEEEAPALDEGGTEAAETEAEQTEVQAQDEPVKEEKLYSWSAAEQLMRDRTEEKEKGRKGTLVYAVTVSALFVICFAILAGLLAFGYINGFGNEVRTVTSERVVYVREDDGSSGILTVQEIAAKVTPSTVYVGVVTSEGTGGGTGFILSTEGYIATNYHVIEGANSITVIFEDGTEYEASLVGGHEMSDLAVIKINPGSRELTPVEFGDSSELLLGDSVVAIGNPSGLELFGSVSTGIISGLDRTLKFYDDNGLVEKSMKLIQINASINPGNSGGPLVDMYGRVIGINTMKLKTTYNYEGVGFAIPSDEAQKVFKELIETGTYSGDDVASKGVSLGISGIEVSKGMMQQVDNAGTVVQAGADGFMVVSITDENSSAYGVLQLYDIITEVEGKTFSGITAMREHLSNLKVGDKLNLTVYRDGQTITVTVTMK